MKNIEGFMTSILKTNIAYDALHSVSNSDTYWDSQDEMINKSYEGCRV